MTEQAKIAYLQEKIKEATKKERSGWVSFTVGIIFGVIGYILYTWNVDYYYQITATGQKIFLRSEYPYQSIGLIAIVAGIVLATIGIAENIYYTVQKSKFMEQLKLMATTIKCPNCGKQILQKTPYCPFCGKQLET